MEQGTLTQVVVARTKPSAKTERLRISEGPKGREGQAEGMMVGCSEETERRSRPKSIPPFFSSYASRLQRSHSGFPPVPARRSPTSGRLQVWSKADWRVVLKRSPDRLDSVIMAVAADGTISFDYPSQPVAF
jgi:hypothetical protein